MAPTKGGSKPSGKNPSKTSSSSSAYKVSKSKSSLKSKGKAPPPKEVKAKPRSAPELLKKKKKRVYTEKELNLPTLNMITPVGVEKPRGKKKGKVFVDDQESMMTILAMVNADKEGQIESRMMKARQMEEIREARREEAKARKEQKKSKLPDEKPMIAKFNLLASNLRFYVADTFQQEETKDSLRKKRKQRTDKEEVSSSRDKASSEQPKRKRVSFA